MKEKEGMEKKLQIACTAAAARILPVRTYT